MCTVYKPLKNYGQLRSTREEEKKDDTQMRLFTVSLTGQPAELFLREKRWKLIMSLRRRLKEKNNKITKNNLQI